MQSSHRRRRRCSCFPSLVSSPKRPQIGLQPRRRWRTTLRTYLFIRMNLCVALAGSAPSNSASSVVHSDVRTCSGDAAATQQLPLPRPRMLHLNENFLACTIVPNVKSTFAATQPCSCLTTPHIRRHDIDLLEKKPKLAPNNRSLQAFLFFFFFYLAAAATSNCTSCSSDWMVVVKRVQRQTRCTAGERLNS